jgi:hypothetical protein
MRDWIKLDSAALNTTQDRKFGGMTFHMQLSPHDVPVAVRSIEGEGALRKFVVEFRYIDEEPWKLEKLEEGISCRVGKYSGRLYGLEIGSSAVRSDRRSERDKGQLSLPFIAAHAIDAAVEIRKPAPKNRAIIENFAAAKAGMSAVGEKLFPADPRSKTSHASAALG